MPLIPLQPLLAPLRWLTAHHWLRASDVDACLRFLQPAWALTRIHARVEARRWVAEDMLAIRLRPNGNWPGAQAGQHVQLFIERDGVRLSRSYSLTAQADGCIEIAVRRQPEGRVSAWLCEHLSIGDCVELGAPRPAGRDPALRRMGALGAALLGDGVDVIDRHRGHGAEDHLAGGGGGDVGLDVAHVVGVAGQHAEVLAAVG